MGKGNYRVHDWQRCAMRDGPLSALADRRKPGVYRDGTGRLRCNRCMSEIHRRAGEMPLREPTILRRRK